MIYEVEHEIQISEFELIENVVLDINSEGFEIDSFELYNEQTRIASFHDNINEMEYRRLWPFIEKYLKHNDVYSTIEDE